MLSQLDRLKNRKKNPTARLIDHVKKKLNKKRKTFYSIRHFRINILKKHHYCYVQYLIDRHRHAHTQKNIRHPAFASSSFWSYPPSDVIGCLIRTRVSFECFRQFYWSVVRLLKSKRLSSREGWWLFFRFYPRTVLVVLVTVKLNALTKDVLTLILR